MFVFYPFDQILGCHVHIWISRALRTQKQPKYRRIHLQQRLLSFFSLHAVTSRYVLSSRTRATLDFQCSLSLVALMNCQCGTLSPISFTRPSTYFCLGLPLPLLASTIPVMMTFSIASYIMTCTKHLSCLPLTVLIASLLSLTASKTVSLITVAVHGIFITLLQHHTSIASSLVTVTSSSLLHNKSVDHTYVFTKFFLAFTDSFLFVSMFLC